MGIRADFYIDTHKPKWIGSLDKDGDPWNIPCKILVQNNVVLYEEYVIEFLTSKGGYIKSNGDKWPWPWEDSNLTDYSYFFNSFYYIVCAYSMHDKMLFNPLKIMQGEDLKTARVATSIKFPLMGVGYGPNTAKII